MKLKLKYCIIPLLFSLYAQAFASSVPFDISVWIPYWRKTEGASSTITHMQTLTQVSPFAFTVDKNNQLKNTLKIGEEPWISLIQEAKKNKVAVYPTVLWGNKDAMEITLNNIKKRNTHIQSILGTVKKYGFDGIDIDYEGKSVETKDAYSRFLKDLSIALKKDNKKLICTIEARTPISSRYATVTPEKLKEIEYANDYVALAKYCYQVRIMAYDQSTDDLTLKTKYKNEMYRPVADSEWVKKVLTLALRDIPASKIVLGIPTYGYKYEYVYVNGEYSYVGVGAMNYSYAEALAKVVGVTPSRNKGGELSFSYSSTTDTSSKDTTMKNYFVNYSDSIAIAEKINIAKEYKLGGVSIFKIDGGNDERLWDMLKK